MMWLTAGACVCVNTELPERIYVNITLKENIVQ
jgi:hypothetical protein